MRIGVAVWLMLILPASGFAQVERYELGKRMKAFEAAWETADEAGRKRAMAILPGVHAQFLTFRLAEAARTLDLATHALRSEDPPGPTTRWAMSLIAVPESRLVDGGQKQLRVTIRHLYAVEGPVPKNAEVQLWFSDKQITTVKPDKIPMTVDVPLPPLGDYPGLDRKLYFMVEAGRVLRRSAVGVSQCDRLAERLAVMKKATDGWAALDTIEKATARDRIELLGRLARGEVPETDDPAADLLANAEAMAGGAPFFIPTRHGQFWMSVPLGGTKTAPVRVFVPKGLDRAKPVPVVVGLHGAGGSENLFFEGYGAGRAVEECRKRGWVFIATRSGLAFTSAPPVQVVLAELGKRYPIDPKRVFVVGHSMGAAQTVLLAQQDPGTYAAVAALAGGGIVKDRAAFTDLPVFIATGEKDFALTAARGLNTALQAAGAKDVTFKEYPDVEHLLVVREALPDVFALFDRVARRK